AWRKFAAWRIDRARVACPPGGGTLLDSPPMTSLVIATGHCSLAGHRAQNEDFLGMVTPLEDELTAKGALAAIADGVSGSGAGREAAEYAVRGLLSDYYAAPDTWEVRIALDRVLNAVNRWLVSQHHARPE